MIIGWQFSKLALQIKQLVAILHSAHCQRTRFVVIGYGFENIRKFSSHMGPASHNCYARRQMIIGLVSVAVQVSTEAFQEKLRVWGLE